MLYLLCILLPLSFPTAPLPSPPQLDYDISILAKTMAGECLHQDFLCGIRVAQTALNRLAVVHRSGRAATLTDILLTPWQYTSLHLQRPVSQAALDFFHPIAAALLYGGTHYARCDVSPRPRWMLDAMQHEYNIERTADGHCWFIEPIPFRFP